MNKNTANESRYFLESNFVGVHRLFALVYSTQDVNSKRIKTRWYYFPEVIINSDVKQYEEIRKLSTGQGEEFTIACLLDYD